MTLKVIPQGHSPFATFSSTIRRTFVQHFTRFQLIFERHVRVGTLKMREMENSRHENAAQERKGGCLLYTSDAADE